MPSPLAHASLALLAIPALDRDRPPMRALLARPLLAALITAFLLLPDVDIALGWLTTGRAFADHGTITHALIWSPLAGGVFALLAKPLTKARWPLLILLGAGLFASHGLMDAFTHGRGVALLWPFVPGRIAPPFEMFVGLRHSEPGNWRAHLVTLGTESLFAGAVWGVAILLHKARRGGARP